MDVSQGIFITSIFYYNSIHDLKLKVNDRVCKTLEARKKDYTKVYQKMGQNHLSFLILENCYKLYLTALVIPGFCPRLYNHS